MKDKIESFFNENGKEATFLFNTGGKFIISAGEKSYTVAVVSEGKVEVEEGRKGGDFEIAGEPSVMGDIFSSKSVEEFVNKIRFYLVQGKKPKLKIFMERSIENTKKFLRDYFPALSHLYIIR